MNKKRILIIGILIFTIGMVLYVLLGTIRIKSKMDRYLTDVDIQLTYKNITDDEAKAELDKDNSIILLDVRTTEEYNEKHIPNSILIPVDELEDRALNEIQDQQTKIFVYCRSGVRSVAASEILVKLGYENVYNLGGIIDWKYEVEGELKND